MILRKAERGILDGFWLARGSLEITHLQFTNDTIIFYDAIEDQIRNVKAILLCFQAVLGRNVNFFKSEMFDIRTNSSYPDILGCDVGSFPSAHLGLPLYTRGATKAIWTQCYKEWRQNLAWRANYLSLFGGRITISKSALS